jgi:hypothetical protein
VTTKQQRAQSKRARAQYRDESGRFAIDKIPSRSKRAVSVKNVPYKGTVYKIPMNSKGKVPKEALVARFMAINSDIGNRSLKIDSSITAEHTLQSELTPEEAVPWWANPNQMDIDGIDTRDGVVLPTKGKVIVIEELPNAADAIAEHLKTNFTIAEIKEGTKDQPLVYYVIDDMPPGLTGAYDPDTSEILISSDFVEEPGTVVHETLHALKHRSDKREGIVTRSHIRKNLTQEERTLEEAATVAETTTRCTPYGTSNISYYGRLAPSEELAEELMDKDRVLFVGSAEGGSKGLKGVRAIKSVEAKFGQSEISKLKLRDSKRTAIQQARKNGYK